MVYVESPLANPDDMSIPQCVANADEAIALVRRYHGKWISSRG